MLSKFAGPVLSILIPSSACLIAQTKPNLCPAPPAVLTATQPNIFSEQQEQWLGDAMADMIESQYRPVQDPAENEYLDRIAKRLLSVLPPTTIQFRVILVDSPEVNGFSLAGGRVYLTRKLVANASSEDEVAAVIAHEMGHILSHQFAIETTSDFKRLLGVTSVSDKADIYAKFQRLIDASMTDKHPSRNGNSDEGQDEADTVAVYAAAAAGYRPQAYSEFWDRMFFVDGKVGGRFSDFFGTTKPESKRLRAILKLVTALPPGCGATEPSAGPEFNRWHALVVANQPASTSLSTKPVSEVALMPPLRMDLEHLRFSHDGKYILAQDESAISVLSRDPYQQIFRFDAENALPAEFTPDSQRIVFHTPGLHTEEWSIPDQKLISSHEPVARDRCVQSKISPDGRTLFCFALRLEDNDVTVDLTALDVAKGDVLYQKKGMFGVSDDWLDVLDTAQRLSIAVDLIDSSVSPDGNTLLMGPGNTKIAFDLQNRVPISIGRDLKNAVSGGYAFVGNDKVIGNVTNALNLTGISVSETNIYSFPDGKKLQTVPFHVADFDSVTSGNFVLTHSLGDYSVAVGDISAGKFIAASSSPSMDVWNGWLLNENADGSTLLHKMGDKTVPDQNLTLPVSPLSSRIFATISADRRLLALSSRTRGAVWDLQSGEQVFLSRGFRSAIFAPDDTLYLEFPKLGKQDRGIHHIEFSPTSGSPVTYKEEDTTHLYGGMLQEWKRSSKKGVDLIVHKVQDNSILWQRTYDGGEPAHTYNLIPGQTIFSFPLKTDFAKNRIKAVPSLATQGAAVKNKEGGRLVQIVDDHNGNVLHELVIEVPLTYEGVNGINVVGDKLYLSSDDNRTMVYALATGAQLRQFFGYVIALDAATERICAVNRRDEAIIYDADGKMLADFYMGSPLRFTAFESGTSGPGSQVLILTADQKIRTMDVPSAPGVN